MILSDQRSVQSGEKVEINEVDNHLLPPGITKDKEGMLRWVYEMHMWKNPTLLLTIWKVLMLATLVPALLLFFLELENGLFKGIILFLKIEGLIGGIVTGLMLVAYLILILINGGKYCVIFEMNHKGIRHIQMQKQFEKSQVLVMIGIVAGALVGSPQAIGSNLLAGSKQSLYCSFNKVKKIVVVEKRHVLYINEDLNHNQVYASKEDMAFIKAYIISHSKKARVINK